MDESKKILKSIKLAQWAQAVLILMASITLCMIVTVFGFRLEALMIRAMHETGVKHAEIMQQKPTAANSPNVTQTASPTITVHNASDGWSLDRPHTVNDAADFLERSPDTIRTYIPRWIEAGIPIEKTEGGMWILPQGFEPYIPE